MIGWYVITLPFAEEVFVYWHAQWWEGRCEGVKTATVEQNLGRGWPLASRWQLGRWGMGLRRGGVVGGLYIEVSDAVCALPCLQPYQQWGVQAKNVTIVDKHLTLRSGHVELGRLFSSSDSCEDIASSSVPCVSHSPLII